MEGEELREILDALSERTRYAILEALSKRSMTGDEIAESVQRSRSTIESHLSLLLRLGLISRKKDDKRYIYEITPKAEAWINREILKFEIPLKRHKYHWWAYVLPLSLLYFFLNSFIIPVPLWAFALIFGVVSIPFCRNLRELSFSILTSSAIVSLLPFLLIFKNHSFLDLLMSFFVSLALVGAISFTLWALLRKALNYADINI